MAEEITNFKKELILSEMAENLVGSEIIKLANEVNERIRNGEHIFNLTIGDFDPSIFSIPADLKEEIIKAYESGHTNYPTSNGIVELRRAVSDFLFTRGGIEYNENQILISGGGRPLIYSTYQALVDPGDSVIYPTPSWNNNHYCHMAGAKQIPIETSPENNFMLSAEDLAPNIEEAALIALCSPLNPTGTGFSEDGLRDICIAIVEENKRRGENQKPLYLLYDQIYWQLTFGDTVHYNPVNLVPEMKEYTVFIDGMSKAFAATGVRIGWGFGPQRIIDKMKAIVGHLGAWSPKAAQVATAVFLKNDESVDTYLTDFKERVEMRLNAFYDGFKTLKTLGFNVDAISPQAAIYLTVKIDLKGLKTPEGKEIAKTSDATQYLLNEAKIALVPFSAFGAEENSPWYRLSIGTASMSDIDQFFENLRKALSKLT
ncbi:MAG: aminotransferase class I/II-fold pyridoxal phosphate-dependent enzyme [Flavobacteriales bacterium]|nr:aminotransferase class I/II-fold pyridoxal phosphate-dependent enzyme [Flavobacteriales bacterium]